MLKTNNTPRCDWCSAYGVTHGLVMRGEREAYAWTCGRCVGIVTRLVLLQLSSGAQAMVKAGWLARAVEVAA
jgi:hypothetical protein